MLKQFLETWSINNRLNQYLLKSIDEEHLIDIAASKGRNVAQQFAHIHNVRLMWLKEAMPELLKGLLKFENDMPIKKNTLLKELDKSGIAINKLLETAIDEGKIKGFKSHPIAFLGYLIAHESHHRGQIMLTLKQNGHPVDKKIQFGLWEWGVR